MAGVDLGLDDVLALHAHEEVGILTERESASDLAQSKAVLTYGAARFYC